jgi:hypothetical protein
MTTYTEIVVRLMRVIGPPCADDDFVRTCVADDDFKSTHVTDDDYAHAHFVNDGSVQSA